MIDALFTLKDEVVHFSLSPERYKTARRPDQLLYFVMSYLTIFRLEEMGWEEYRRFILSRMRLLYILIFFSVILFCYDVVVVLVCSLLIHALSFRRRREVASFLVFRFFHRNTRCRRSPPNQQH